MSSPVETGHVLTSEENVTEYQTVEIDLMNLAVVSFKHQYSVGLVCTKYQ